MEKLELKHLAPYILHNLRIMDLYDDKESIFCGISKTEHNYEVKIYRKESIVLSRFLSEVKPILRPLTDLTKEIEIKTEKFIPCFEMNLKLEDVEKMINSDVYIGQWWSYEMVEKLFEWHFDLFELIPNGLAMDINTL